MHFVNALLVISDNGAVITVVVREYQALKKSDGMTYAVKEIRLDYAGHHDLASSVLDLLTYCLICFFSSKC